MTFNLGNLYSLSSPSSQNMTFSDGWNYSWNLKNPDVQALSAPLFSALTTPSYNQTYIFPNQNAFSGIPNRNWSMPTFGNFGMQNQNFGMPAFGNFGMQNQNFGMPAFGNLGMQNQNFGMPAFGNFGMPNQSLGMQNALPQAFGQGIQGGQQQNSGLDINKLLGMFMMIKQLKQLETVAKASSSAPASPETPTSSVATETPASSAATETPADKPETFKVGEKAPLKAFKDFVSNTNDEAKLQFGNSDRFAERTYNAFKGKKGTDPTLNKILEAYGISPDELSGASEAKLNEFVNPDTNTVPLEKYKEFIAELGINSDNPSITRGAFKENIDKLKKGTKTEDKAEAEAEDPEKTPTKDDPKSEPIKDEKALVKNENRLKEILEKDPDTLSKSELSEIQEIVKRISGSSKAVVSKFMADLKDAGSPLNGLPGEGGATNALSAIFTTFAEADQITDDTEAIETYKTGILDPLKEAAKKHGLAKDWNEILGKNLGLDKKSGYLDAVMRLSMPSSTGFEASTEIYKMQNEVRGFSSIDSGDGATIANILDDAIIKTKAEDRS